MYLFFLLFLSILPVFLVGFYIYNKDNDKEPLILLAKLFLGGVCACVLTLILSFALSAIFPRLMESETDLSLIELFFRVFFCIALIEEGSKWIFTYNIAFYDKEFDQVYDMLVYSVFVSLGFACVENVFYVLDGGVYTAVIRALTAIPGHACFGVFMGYYLALSKLSILHGNINLKKKNMLLSIFVPVLLHGIYDYFLLSGSVLFIVLCLILIIALYITVFKRIKKISSIYGKMKYKDNYCPNCGRRVLSAYCPTCGRKNE